VAKDTLTYDDLIASLEKKSLAQVYLLHGEEDFLAEEGTNAVIAAALNVAEREFNLDILRGSEADIRDVLSLASSFPMMAERRVVVLKEVDRLSPKELELVAGYVDNPSPTSTVVLVAVKADMRRRPFSVIKRVGAAFECKPLYENRIPGWIESRVAGRNAAITPEACKMLAAYVGNSLRGLNNEIDKLFTYLGDTQTITAEDVSAVAGMSKEYGVFDLQRAIGAKDLKRSAEILEHMLEAGENVPFIIIMLTSYFVTLLKLHDLRLKGSSDRELASEARVHPFFLKEYLEAVRTYPRSELEDAFGILARADERVKTSSGDDGSILHAMLIELLHLQADPVFLPQAHF
jgi:DNA polymerase-3 subunit delta